MTRETCRTIVSGANGEEEAIKKCLELPEVRVAILQPAFCEKRLSKKDLETLIAEKIKNSGVLPQENPPSLVVHAY